MSPLASPTACVCVSEMAVLASGPFEHDLGGDQVLAQTIVQFARNAAAFFVLRGNKAGGKPAQFAVQHFELLRALR